MLRANIFPEDIGRYLTPFMAIGIKQGIMIALKINAERIALFGVAKCIIFKTDNSGTITT